MQAWAPDPGPRTPDRGTRSGFGKLPKYARDFDLEGTKANEINLAVSDYYIFPFRIAYTTCGRMHLTSSE